MRRTVVMLALLIGSTPALAQAPAAQVPPELTDPATVDRVAGAMQAISDTFLDLRVGALHAALEGRTPTASDKKLTLRDLGRRENPNFDRDLDRRIANARPVIKQSMKTLAVSLPAVMQELNQAQESIERAVANIPDPTYPAR